MITPSPVTQVSQPDAAADPVSFTFDDFVAVYPWVPTYRFTTREAMWDDVATAVLDRRVPRGGARESATFSRVAYEIIYLAQCVVQSVNERYALKFPRPTDMPMDVAAKVIAHCCDVRMIVPSADTLPIMGRAVGYGWQDCTGIYAPMSGWDYWSLDFHCAPKKPRSSASRLEKRVRAEAAAYPLVATVDPYRLILGNGIWDLSRRELLPFTPDYVTEYKPAVEMPEVAPPEPVYHFPDGQSVTVTELLGRWTLGTTTAPIDLYKVIAASLHPTYRFNKAVLVRGRPMIDEDWGGVTTNNCAVAAFFDLLKALHGRAACSVSRLWSLCDYELGTSYLHGTSLLLCENPYGDRVENWDVLKKVLEHEPVAALDSEASKKPVPYRPHAFVVTDEDEVIRAMRPADRRKIDFYTVSLAVNADPDSYSAEVREWLTSKEVLTWIVSHVLRTVVAGLGPSLWLSGQ